jgi:hypothetical protein
MIVVFKALKPRLARGCLEHISQSCVFRISVLRPVTERAMKGEVVHLSCFVCAINLAEEKRCVAASVGCDVRSNKIVVRRSHDEQWRKLGLPNVPYVLD